MRNVITIARVSLGRQFIGLATLVAIAVLLARQDHALARIGSVACVAGAVGELVRGLVRIDLQNRVVTTGFQIAGLVNLTRRRIPLSSVVGVLVWFRQDHRSVDVAVRTTAWHVELVLNDDRYLLVREEETTRPGEKAARELASELAARLRLPLRIVESASDVRPAQGCEK